MVIQIEACLFKHHFYRRSHSKMASKEHCMCIKQKQNISSQSFLPCPSTLKSSFQFVWVTYKSMGCVMCSVMSSLIFLDVQAVLVTLIVLSALFTNKYSCMQSFSSEKRGADQSFYLKAFPTKVFHFGNRISSNTAPQGFP